MSGRLLPLLLVAASVACGGGDRARSRRPSGQPNDNAVAERYPDLAALYGGEHGIYRSCSPNEGVCHNDAEYPDLSSLGSLTMLVGAECNRGRHDATEVHDLCERPGDLLEVEGARVEIASVTSPHDLFEDEYRKRFGEGDEFSADPVVFSELERFEARYDGNYFDALLVRTRNPSRAGPGTVARLERREEGKTRTLATYRVRERHRLYPKDNDLVVLELPQARPWQGNSDDFHLIMAARTGDPNDNGIFGAQLGGGLVVPGHPERSYLVRRLVDPAAGPLMPRANCCTWTKQSLRAMYCWIAGLKPDGSNALDPIDYDHCPPGPEEDVAYPEQGPTCKTSGMCPVMPQVEVDNEATWDVVLGVLGTRCGDASCHGTSAYGLDLSSPAAARASTRNYVIPGLPADSELYRRITPHLARAAGIEPMPLRTDPLPLRERELVRAWIAGLVAPSQAWSHLRSPDPTGAFGHGGARARRPGGVSNANANR